MQTYDFIRNGYLGKITNEKHNTVLNLPVAPSVHTVPITLVFKTEPWSWIGCPNWEVWSSRAFSSIMEINQIVSFQKMTGSSIFMRTIINWKPLRYETATQYLFTDEFIDSLWKGEIFFTMATSPWYWHFQMSDKDVVNMAIVTLNYRKSTPDCPSN